jgi:hypothetical protein
VKYSASLINLVLFTSLLVAACATPPKEVASSQTAAPTSSSGAAASPGSAPSTIAPGHGGAPAGAANPSANPNAGLPMPSTQTTVKWTAPARWQTGPERPMRAATYLIPAAPGDTEGGECAVFANIGGGVQANLDRWVGQFELPGGGDPKEKVKTKKETINGLAVTTIDLSGTYKGGGVAMGQASAPKPGYRLLGAIVEGPGGEVFFKMTGPAKTIAAAEKDFQALLNSVSK